MPQGRERTVQPRYVQATLVQLEPRKKLVKKAKVSKQSVENERTKKIEKQRAEAKRQESAEQKKKQRALEAKKRKEQLAREKQKKREQQAEEALRREQELAFASALDEEEEYIAAGKDEQLVASYSAYIVERISANWSRPPSARRGMEVALSIQMVPTGRVVSVAVEQSSGNLAFDRSTEQAVYKVERFDKLQELAQSRPQVFEATFRRFRLVFRPDDLRL
jgi:colicin import membrane protein